MFQNSFLDTLETKKILSEARPQTQLGIASPALALSPLPILSSQWYRRCSPQSFPNKSTRKCGAITLTFIFIFLVQKPAPPNITEIVITHYYALVRYKINTKDSESSYITNFIVFLNENGDQNVPTQGKRQFFLLSLEPLCTFALNIQDGSLTQRTCTGKNKIRETGFFIFRQLKPNTQYTFEIITQDGSKQNSSKVTENFKTDEAGISVKKYQLISINTLKC